MIDIDYRILKIQQLAQAALTGYPDVIKLLVEHGTTNYEVAIRSTDPRNSEIISYLRQHLAQQ